jgi:hypothetical protein
LADSSTLSLQGRFSSMQCAIGVPACRRPTRAEPGVAGQVPRSMNGDVIRRGCFPEAFHSGADSQALVLLCICFFARRDDSVLQRLGCRSYVGQVGNLRRIANPPVSLRRKASLSKVFVARDAPPGLAFHSWERVVFPPRKRAHISVNAARMSACATDSVGPQR